MKTHPPLTKVTSTNIDSIGFDNRGLYVRFQGGQLYKYPEAPKTVHDEMLKAESPGRFFSSRIRGVYAHMAVNE